VHLVRDVLDKQLTDGHGRAIGKADSIVMRLRANRPPLITAIEVGGVTGARRLPRLFRRMLEAAARRWGMKKGEPYRIDWDRLHMGKVDIRVDLDAARTPLLAREHRIRDRIIARLPGSGRP
jgi:hypothetical protein